MKGLFLSTTLLAQSCEHCLVLGTIRMEALYSVGKAENRNQHPLGKGEGEIERCLEEIHLKLMIDKKLHVFLTGELLPLLIHDFKGFQGIILTTESVFIF